MTYAKNSYPKNIRILIGANMFICYVYKDRVEFADKTIPPLKITEQPSRTKILIHIKKCKPMLRIFLE